MPDFTVASTTDTQEAVNQAAGAVQEPETDQKPVQKQPEPQKEAEKTGDPAEKSIKKMEKRIDRVTAERQAAREEADGLRARLAALEQASRQPVQQQAVHEPIQQPTEADLGIGPEPKQDDFSTYEEWVRAIARWEYKKERAQENLEYQKQLQVEAEQAIKDTYKERVLEFRKTHSDWDTAIAAMGEMYLPPGVGQTIMELENGPEVAYYIAKHPDAGKRIGEMPAHLAVAEIGKLAATMGRDEAINTPGFRTDRLPVSSAPAPIKPLTGHSTKSSQNLDEMDYSEYRKIRDQQEKARYRR